MAFHEYEFRNTPLFDELRNKYEESGEIDIKEISQDVMEKLSWLEGIKDNDLGILFGKNEQAMKRYRYRAFNMTKENREKFLASLKKEKTIILNDYPRADQFFKENEKDHKFVKYDYNPFIALYEDKDFFNKKPKRKIKKE